MPQEEKLHDFVNLCMVQALVELMQSKPFDKITATELTAKAGVGRVSFYRNFGCKEAILRFHIRQLFDSTGAPAETYEVGNLEHSIEEKLKIIETNQVFFHSLVREDLVWLFYDEMFGITYENIKAHHLTRNKYQPYFYAGAANSVLIQWVKSGMEESTGELAAIIVELIKGYL